MIHIFTNPFYREYRQSAGFSRTAKRTVTLLAMLSAGVAVLGAQTSTTASAPAAQQSTPQAQSSAQASSSDALFSTSATEEAGTPIVEASVVPTTPDFAKMMREGAGQQQGYNRPRYQSSYENADGSNKWVFYGGAGFSQTVGNTWHYLTPNYKLQFGGGRQFNKHFALPVEFDFDYFDPARHVLGDQSTIYFNQEHVGLGGNSHIWSFSIDPTYTFYSGNAWGAYVVGGIGYFHKVANFTLPGAAYECYYFCSVYDTNQNIDHYTSNAPGYDGGFGLTYKFSNYSKVRFYAEARYVFVDNQQRSGVTINNYTTAPLTSTDLYPANSNRTTYIPITFGFRF